MNESRDEWKDRIGVGTTNYALQRTGPTRVRPVVTEEGPTRGTVGGVQTDHADGRVDATIHAPCVTITPKLEATQ